MSEHQTVFLSTGDYFLLQGFNLPEGDDRDVLATMLRRKLDAAIVTFPADVGSDVITTGCKVRYRIGGVRTEERTLVAGPNDPAGGLALCLTSPRGMALIGMSVGQSVIVPLADGSHETLLVEEVSRPEASDRAAEGGDSTEPPTQILPFTAQQPFRDRASGPTEHGDDPGPSAA